MNCLIVDDNKMARMALRQLASEIKDLIILGECENALDAYNIIQDQSVDLLLLDIEMPGMTGLELTRNLGNKKLLIIFTISNKEYAVEAFELNVADYIVKPVTTARFVHAIERAREILESKQEQLSMEADEVLFIRDSNVVKRLNMDDLLYIEAMGDYVKLFTAQKFFAVHTTLKAVEERLPATRFLRVHRSYIVAIQKIDSLKDGAIIIKDKAIPIADSYRAALNKRLNIL